MKNSTLYWFVFVLPLLVKACATSSPASLNATLPAAAETPFPRLVATSAPRSTAAPVATATRTLHPLQIEAMRARQYPGSDITIEKTLDPGENYARYYVSYLSEGLKIYALMTVPNGEKPPTGWPVIIFNHGYIPPEIYRTTERYVAYVDLIARSGYIVFRSDYRGHDQSEGEARGAYSYPDYTVDVLNALASMKRYPDADPNRIGMWGHSMGGYITLRSMVISKDIRAGVIWGGVVASYPDLMRKWRRGPNAEATPTPSPRSWRSSIINEYGTPEENPAFWNSISANSYLQDISGPLQLDHSTTDEEVPVEFSETLYFLLLDLGKYVELYKYEGDNHNISGHFSTAMARTIEFFDRFVKTGQ
jgi:dipeptidyl aminopeptidase/acylaminoacyl peptidase